MHAHAHGWQRGRARRGACRAATSTLAADHPAGERGKLPAKFGAFQRGKRAVDALTCEPARGLEAVERRVGRLARCRILARSLAKIGRGTLDIEDVVDD